IERAQLVGDGLAGLRRSRVAAGPTIREPEAAKQNWLLPVPWYLDELDWEEAEAQSYGLDATLASSSPSRVWSPSVSAPAARAAELLAAARQGASRERTSESPIPKFTYVTPADLGRSLESKSWEPTIPSRPAAPSLAAPSRPAGSRPVSPAVSPASATPTSIATPTAFEQADQSGDSAKQASVEATSVEATSVEATEATSVEATSVEAAAPEAAQAPSATPALRPAALAPAAGPRVGLSVGLRGLVSSMASQAALQRPIAPLAASARASAPLPVAGFAEGGIDDGVSELAAPALSMPVVGPALPTLATSGYQSAATPPRSLAHVSWADRWLGRFAGASPEALGTLGTAASWAEPPVIETPPQLGSWLGTVVVPRVASAESEPAQPAAAGPAPRAQAPTPAAPRSEPPSAERLVIDDDEQTTDDMFAQIAAAASVERTGRPRPGRPRPDKKPVAPATRPAPREAEPAPPHRAAPSLADRVMTTAHRSWAEPGLRVELAASPAAAALRSTLGIVPTTPFDVRGLSAAAPRVWVRGALRGLVGETAGQMPGTALASLAPSLSWVTNLGVEPERLAVARPSQIALASEPRRRRTFGGVLPTVAPQLGGRPTSDDAGATRTKASEAATPAARPEAVAAAAAAMAQPSPGMEMAASAELATAIGAATATAARTQQRELAMDRRPGSLGQRSLGFAGRRRDKVGGLADDYVSPELVMAARVYGFGPLEALAAARLASAGPAAIQSTASAVDLAFVQLASERAKPAAAPRASRQTASEAKAPIGAAATRPAASPVVSGPTVQTSGAKPGGPRSAPRGSFLWPQAAVSALGLRLADADAQVPYSRAALDVIAAMSVLELGPLPARKAGATPATASQVAQQSLAQDAASPAPAAAASRPDRQAAGPAWADWSFDLSLVAAADAEGQSIPLSVRAAQALALAQAQSGPAQAPAGKRELARRALARMPEPVIAQRRSSPGAASPRTAVGGEQGERSLPPVSALEKLALVAPAVHPVIAAERAAAPSPAEARVASAGRSLASLVQTGQAATAAPMTHQQAAVKKLISKPSTGSDAKVITEAVMKASKVSSLPPWFEDAARKLLSGDSDQGMSFEELVLISTAGPGAMAASSKSASSGGTGSQADASGGTGTGETYGAPPAPDVEVLAREVYDLVLSMLDVARARIGDPWEKV
ncbi:MAG: hypothetical protein KJO07_12670, partial [Deltaproteobacteria bacterium]|nr:hypothetical protein [Deltaproteobacteria bacterium]